MRPHYVRHTQVQFAARAPRQQNRPLVHALLLPCTRVQQPLTYKLTPSTAAQQSQHHARSRISTASVSHRSIAGRTHQASTAAQQSQHLARSRISTASVSHRSIARRTHQVCSTHAPASALSARTRASQFAAR